MKKLFILLLALALACPAWGATFSTDFESTGTPTGWVVPGGGGTVDFDCSTGSCPLSGSESLKITPAGQTVTYYKLTHSASQISVQFMYRTPSTISAALTYFRFAGAGGEFIMDVYIDAGKFYTWDSEGHGPSTLSVSTSTTYYFWADLDTIVKSFKLYISTSSTKPANPEISASDMTYVQVGQLWFMADNGDSIFDDVSATYYGPLGVESLGNIGTPVFDRNTEGRIWALSYNGTKYDGIQYSDNYGTTWVSWTNWGNTYTLSPYLAMDISGNFYFSSVSDPYLYRCDASTKSITQVITWYPNPGTPTSFAWYPWHWAEKDDGTIFTTAYSNDSAGLAYIYKSTNSGVDWTRIDKLVTDYGANKHVHSLHCNPYNNKVYFSIGDDAATEIFGVTTNDFSTVTAIGTGAPAMTGLTFTSEANWWVTDYAVGTRQEIVSSDDASGTVRYTFPNNPIGKTPLYYIRAVGDNEFWVIAVDDGASSTYLGSITKLTKTAGVGSAFTVQQVYTGDDPDINGRAVYTLSHNGRGVIPTWAKYIFFDAIRFQESPSGPAREVYRVKRSWFASKSVSGQFVINDGGPYDYEIADCSNVSGTTGMTVNGAATITNSTALNCPTGAFVFNETATLKNSIGYSSGADITIAAGKTVTGTYNLFGDAGKSGTGTYSDGGSTTLWSTDPLLSSNGRIPHSSPAYGAGTFITGLHDAAGATDGFGAVLQPRTGRYIFDQTPAIGAHQPKTNIQDFPDKPWSEFTKTWSASAGAGGGGSFFLETGDYLLLETGDKLLLE